MEEIDLEAMYKAFDVKIEGFTKELEKELKNPKSKVFKMDPDEIIYMYTYRFALLAYQHNAPLKLIKVMETMKERYASAKILNRKFYGLLLDLEGKAYAYMSINSKNYEEQNNFYKIAYKCFEDAFKSYHCIEAKYDLAELSTHFKMRVNAVLSIQNKVKEDNEKYTKMGYLFCDLYTLANNASRVLQGKRPLISNSSDLDMARHYFDLGVKNDSLTSEFAYGLLKIIRGDTKNGLETVEKHFSEIKKYYDKFELMMFASDFKPYKDAFEIIETKVLKNKNKR